MFLNLLIYLFSYFGSYLVVYLVLVIFGSYLVLISRARMRSIHPRLISACNRVHAVASSVIQPVHWDGWVVVSDFVMSIASGGDWIYWLAMNHQWLLRITSKIKRLPLLLLSWCNSTVSIYFWCLALYEYEFWIAENFIFCYVITSKINLYRRITS